MASIAEAVIKCKGKDYAELSIDQWRLLILETRCTFFERVYDSKGQQNSDVYSLHLASLQYNRSDN